MMMECIYDLEYDLIQRYLPRVETGTFCSRITFCSSLLFSALADKHLVQGILANLSIYLQWC